MNEIFLLKLGEVVLKGSNKAQFENRLRSNVSRRMRPFGEFLGTDSAVYGLCRTGRGEL